MAKIYLDAGHGGKDGGAGSGKRKEKDDVLKMTLAVGKRLTERGVSVKYARTDDTEKKLNDRTAESNAWGAQYYLSIHRNSASPDATGNEIWVKSDATEKTVEKAAKILQAACEADGLRNRGVKKGAPSYTDFAVNKYTICFCTIPSENGESLSCAFPFRYTCGFAFCAGKSMLIGHTAFSSILHCYTLF